MALLNFWKNSREDVLRLRIEQVVSSAGDGQIRDASECSAELRQFFKECPAETLSEYVDQILEKPFAGSGFVLQDLVNEFGRRLDFEVEDGLYRGKPSAIGFDGIWRFGNELPVIIEVKTTDYVAVDLETHARYKDRLIQTEKVCRDSSTLIVVGREDTGALEAQIRGSRYAWEMRLISVDRLVRLAEIKAKSGDSKTSKQIRQLLRPFEYTKVDGIIDVIFTTAVDVESQQEIEPSPEAMPEEVREPSRQNRTSLELLNAKRQDAVDAFSAVKSCPLIKRGTTLFSDPDKKVRVCCAVSKRYESDYQPYWYAFHPSWNDFLGESDDSYFVLACMDREEAFAVPHSWLKANLNKFNMTDRGERSYWHVPITTLPNGHLAINMSKVGEKRDLSTDQFLLFE
jgi:hypothetical protein